MTVKITGKISNILVDQGALVHSIDHQLFNQLKSPDTKIETPDAKIYPYGAKTSLELLCKVKFQV